MTLGNDGGQSQFYDSDEDESPSAKSKGESSKKIENGSMSGTLHLKIGANSSSTLYFVDQTKLSNNGDGLDSKDKNELLEMIEKTKLNKEALENSLKNLSFETKKLLSEPQNCDLNVSLEKVEETQKMLKDNLEKAQEYKCNESHRGKLRKANERMSSFWRKRKQICKDFLFMMEETTEGTVSMKKCMSGDGQIEIDSDESAIIGATTFAKKMMARTFSSSSSRKKRTIHSSRLIAGTNKRQKLTVDEFSDYEADTQFVAVKLNQLGFVERVYMENEK